MERLMKERTALVLTGGGNRGAIQAGALLALFEHGFRPDLIVGMSVGAINGVLLSSQGHGELLELRRVSYSHRHHVHATACANGPRPPHPRQRNGRFLPSRKVWAAFGPHLDRNGSENTRNDERG